jgi:peptidoglycan L-alanyl-D-glutamate endopeptidase CwlK
MINSRDLKDLHPRVRVMVEQFIKLCAAEGIDVLITSTYRDLESQAALYAQGRSTFGNVVTNANAGQSFHNYRVAFDFVPLVNGKAQWNDVATFARCGAIAQKIGLEWAGAWKRFKELAHCQYTGGLTLADLQAGKTLPA